MNGITLLALLLSTATARVIPRAAPAAAAPYVPAGHCCFTLHEASSGQVVHQEDPDGLLLLGGAEPQGWYCLDLADDRGILLDAENNACFISPDARVVCLDPIPGVYKWTLANGKSRLAYDGQTGYQACPNESAAGELLWTDHKDDKSGCRAVNLQPKGFQGTC